MDEAGLRLVLAGAVADMAVTMRAMKAAWAMLRRTTGLAGTAVDTVTVSTVSAVETSVSVCRFFGGWRGGGA